ncbi:hypothetical protein, partial [Escherichia coli]
GFFINSKNDKGKNSGVQKNTILCCKMNNVYLQHFLKKYVRLAEWQLRKYDFLLSECSASHYYLTQYS